jgi:hypothetical protein
MFYRTFISQTAQAVVWWNPPTSSRKKRSRCLGCRRDERLTRGFLTAVWGTFDAEVLDCPDAGGPATKLKRLWSQSHSLSMVRKYPTLELLCQARSRSGRYLEKMP